MQSKQGCCAGNKNGLLMPNSTTDQGIESPVYTVVVAVSCYL